MKKVLYFFPDDLSVITSGNKTRAKYLLEYFKKLALDVHFVSIQHEPECGAQERLTNKLLLEKGLASRFHILRRKGSKKNLLLYFFKYKIWNLLYYLTTFPAGTAIPTVMTIRLKSAFENLLKCDSYDYIVISYVYYSDLVSRKDLLGNAKVILDTHDFITAQFKSRRDFRLGITFEDEMRRLGHFHEIWAISAEEQYIFRQFCKAKVRLVPFTMDEPTLNHSLTGRKYDVIYVASDNIHNQRASKWFFSKVYPLLPPNIRICVIGKITAFIDNDLPIERVLYSSELDDFYNNAWIAICPMLSGSGIKIKVVEALSYGLPVVCNDYGTDGLPNKINNGCLVANDPESFARSIEMLLEDKALYERQSGYAKSLFRDYFRSDNLDKILDPVFK